MGDVDAGNIKAKAEIEYDPSGMKQFKEDLASLPEMVGGLGQSAGQAGEALSGLDEGMSSNAESAKSFTSAIGELPKMVEGGSSSISEMTGALSEHRSAVEETAGAYESLQKPIESTVSSLEKAAPSMQVVSEHTQKIAESLQSVSFDPKSFGMDDFVENTTVFQNALSDPAPFSTIKEHLLETGQTWGDFTSSLSESNAAMFSEMVQRTSGSYQVLDKAASSAQNVGQVFHESASSAAEFTAQFNSVDESAGKASSAINEVGSASGKLYDTALYGSTAGKASFGGAFSEVMGGAMGILNDIAMPLMAIQMIGMAVQQVGQGIYDMASIAEGPAAHSVGTFTGTVDALGQAATRSAASFSEGFGQGIMPTLNALNNQAGGGGGLGDLGGLVGGLASTAVNLTMMFGPDPSGGMEGLINQGAGLFGMQQPFQGPAPQTPYQQQMNALPQTVQQNAQQLQYQGSLTMAQATDPNWLAANNQAMASQSAAQYLVQSYDISHPIPRSQVIQEAQYQSYAAQQQQNYQYQMDNQPSFWQNLGDELGPIFNTPLFSSGGNQQRITNQPPAAPFDGWFGTGTSTTAAPAGKFISDSNAGKGIDWGGMGQGFNDFFGGLGQDWNNLFNQASPAPAMSSMGGCFVAGTPVLLADGTQKPIETLRVDERVLAHDGTKQVQATIIACIMFPAKQTYALTFSDGNVLVTTDSHPLQGVDGWKSISPASTHRENPGLPVTTLAVGDDLYTTDGTLCRLVSIQKRAIVPVYNITVNPHHTYYAGGILVHNAKARADYGGGAPPGGGGGLGDFFGGIGQGFNNFFGGANNLSSSSGVGSEQVSLNHTFTANVEWQANGLEKQFTGVASWQGQGLSNQFTGQASWVGQGLANTFKGAASWVGSNLANTFKGAASWVGQGLSNLFTGQASWQGQNLSNTFQGVASWQGQGLTNTFTGQANWQGENLTNTFTGQAEWQGENLSNTFTGKADWTADNLDKTFTGKADWKGDNLEHLFVGNAQWQANNLNPTFYTSPTWIPGFADGVSNFSGGPAIVGEGDGPEVVEANGQYSLYESASLVNLPAGANVYPMRNLEGSSVAQFANGTGNSSPISIGGGSTPQSLNLTIQIGAETIWSAIGMPLMQNINLASGNRSY